MPSSLAWRGVSDPSRWATSPGGTSGSPAATHRARHPGGDGGLSPSRPIVQYPEHYARVGGDQRSAGDGRDENGVAAMTAAAMLLHEPRVADNATQTEGGGRHDKSRR